MKTIIKPVLAIIACGIALTAAAQQSTPVLEAAGNLQIARVGQVQADTVSTLQWSINTEQQLAASPGSPNPADLPQAVAEAEAAHAKKLEEIESLTHKLKELLAAVAVGETTKTNLNQQISEWEKKLAAAKAELAELAKQEAELMRRLTDEGKGSGMATGVGAGDRKSIAVIINHNCASPLERPYFRGEQIRWTDGDTGLKIFVNQDGMPLGKALEPNGWLAKALDGATPEKNFVSMLVSPDSVATYYALLKELRQRKLRHSWNSWDGVSFTIITHHIDGNSGGGSPGGVQTY